MIHEKKEKEFDKKMIVRFHALTPKIDANFQKISYALMEKLKCAKFHEIQFFLAKKTQL